MDQVPTRSVFIKTASGYTEAIINAPDFDSEIHLTEIPKPRSRASTSAPSSNAPPANTGEGEE